MARNPKSNPRSKPSASSRGTCRDLVWVDSRPLRDQARRDYDKTRQALAKAQAQLDRFENHDRPQFLRWLSQNFGRLLTEIRELGLKVIQNEELMLRVESEALATGCSYQRAYQRVTQQQAESERPDNASGQRSRGARDPSPEFEDADEFFQQYFEQQYQATEKSAESTPAARLKELYRALVRLLHPDKNKNLTDQQREWWHQGQAAYQARDEAQLELILTLCELERQDHDLRRTTLSLIRRIIDRLKSSLRELRRKLRAYQEEPAWQFSLRQNHELLHHRLQLQLEHDLFVLREAYQESQAQLKEYKRKPRRGRDTQPDWWP